MTYSTALGPAREWLDVIVAPKPFTPTVDVTTVEAGVTVAQLLTRACRSGVLSIHDLPRTEVYIDGLRLADRLAAHSLVPDAGSTVNIVVLPQGGGGGHKNPLQMALQLAIMVAAFAIAGPAGPLAGAGGLLAGAGITGLAATAIEVSAMAAINLAGTMALSAIFGGSATASTTAPIYSLENQSNSARLGKAMPLCLGARRAAFDVAATAYSTIVNTDSYITVIYGVHYGPCTLSDLKIGETLVSAYPANELTVEYHLTPGSRESSLYPSRIDQASLQNELDPLHADWTTETSGIEAMRLEVDLYWPQLIYTSSGGEQKNQDSVVYIQYSPYGANQWLPAPGLPSGRDADGNAYPAGSYWIQEKTQNPTRRTVGWDVASGQYDVRLGRRIRRGGDTTRSVDDVTWTSLRTINTAQPAIADQTLSIVIIKAKASQDFSGTLGTVTGVVTPIVPAFDLIAQVWKGDPAAYDAVNWQATSNAAALARYLLTGYPAAKPLSAAQVDSSFGQHYATIEAMNWHGGMLQADDASQEDVLVKLGKLGRCYFYWNGEAACCAPDYTKPAPRQVFSGRNAKDYQYKRVFPDPIHAVYVTFDNADEDWKPDGLYVYNDGYDASNAVLREEMALTFACDMNRAHREGRVYLAKRKLLTETHQWTAGVDSIASTFGDRVAVRHISTLFGIGEARVKFRRFQGGLVGGLRLDTSVTFQAGQTYTIDVRRHDQVIRGLPLTTSPGTTRDLVLAVPVSTDDAPLAGDLVVVGQTGVVTEDVEIVDISPKPDGSADIVAQSYRAADIVAAETAAIPLLQSALTARVAAPVPVIVGALGSVNGVVVSFDVVPQRQATIQGFTARWRRSPDEDATATWNTLPLRGATDRTVKTPAFPDAQVVAGGTAEPFQVDVEIRTILSTGETSQPGQALNIVVQKGVLAPTNFAALPVVRTAQDGSSYPAIQVDCDPQDAGSTQDLVVELQPAGAAPAAWRASSSGPFHADLPEGDLTDVVGGQSYDVRARWRTADNWYSDYVTQAGVAVPSGSLVAATVAAIGSYSPDDLVALAEQTANEQESAGETAIAALIADAQQSADLSQANYALGLIGTLSADKTAWVIDASTFQVSPGVSMTGRLAGIAGDVTGAQTSISVLQQASAASTAAIGAESVVRAAADSAQATQIGSLTAQVGTVAASVTTEQSARVSGDSALSVQIINTNATVGANAASIASETSARVSGDGSLAAQLTSLGAAVGSNTSAIQTETSARATADSALSVQIVNTNSTVATNIASLSQETVTRAAADSAQAQQLFSLTATVGTNTGSIQSEGVARVSGDSALSGRLDSLNASFGSLTSTVTNNYAALSTAQAATAASVNTLSAQFQTGANIVVNGSFGEGASPWTIYNGFPTPGSDQGPFLVYNPGPAGELLTPYLPLAVQTVPVGAGVAYAPQARIYLGFIGASSTFARVVLQFQDNGGNPLGPATAVQANVRQGWLIIKLDATTSGALLAPTGAASCKITLDIASSSGNLIVTGDNVAFGRIKLEVGSICTAWSDDQLAAAVTASVQQEASARATADSAQATTLNSLQAQVGSNSSAISTETSARVSGDSALSVQIINTNATVGANTSSISNEAATRAANDNTISATVTSLTATVGANASAISQESSARTSGDSAISFQLSNLTATVGANTSAIQTEASARANADSTQAQQLSSLTATVGANTASISINSAAVAGLQGRTYAYMQEVVAASGSAPAIVQLYSGNGASLADLIATALIFSNVDGSGGMHEVLRLINGAAYFRNPIYVGAPGANDVILGPGLGPDGQGILYFGSSQYTAATASGANGLMFRGDGSIQDGAGVLSAAAGGAQAKAASIAGASAGNNSWTDVLTLTFANIPKPGFWSQVQADISGAAANQSGAQASFVRGGGRNATGQMRVVERQSGKADIVIAAPSTVTATGDSDGASITGAISMLRTASNYTGQVSLVLQAECTTASDTFTGFPADLGSSWLAAAA